ncbi:MAG: ketoacyl-ACP synthase III [Bacteroidetes bacterium]|nr:ketoacyl-ACP synthase III [Bacteroidota bacterium]
MHNIRSLGNIEICGVAASVPSQKFDFSNYPYFTESDKKEFAKLVGVESKRYSNGKLTSSDLCFASAQSLLMELNWEPEEVELLILVTQSPDYTVPASAVLLQHRLNLSNKAIVFDINLGCSGWVYGLLTVAALMKSVNIKKALLLTGETSIIANYQDKSSFPLMGDAGAATALTITDSDCQMHFDINVAGDGYQAIIAKQSGARHRAMNNELQSYNHDVTLDGGKVLDFCLRKVAPSIVKLLSETNTDPATIDYFVFHQANRIINENLRKN